MTIYIPLGILLVYLGLRAWGQPRDKDRVSYWHQSIASLDDEPDVLFAQVYQALKAGLEDRDVQLFGMGFGPTKLFETRWAFSRRPLYLQVKYKHLSSYLYVGQAPIGLFLSYRVYNKYVKGEGENAVLSFPALLYFWRQSMFQYDASLMFIESVHGIVLQAVEEYLAEKKLKPLEEHERRPILHAFYARAYPPRPQQVWTVPSPSTTRNSVSHSVGDTNGQASSRRVADPGSTSPSTPELSRFLPLTDEEDGFATPLSSTPVEVEAHHQHDHQPEPFNEEVPTPNEEAADADGVADIPSDYIAPLEATPNVGQEDVVSDSAVPESPAEAQPHHDVDDDDLIPKETSVRHEPVTMPSYETQSSGAPATTTRPTAKEGQGGRILPL